MEKMLQEQIEQWQQEHKYQSIVEAIQTLPVEQWDYQSTYQLGCALNQLGQFKQAKRILEQLEEQGDQDCNYWLQYGYTLYKLGQDDKALDALGLATSIDPDHQQAKEFMQFLLEDRLRNGIEFSFQQRVAEFWQLFVDQEYELRSMLTLETDGQKIEAYVKQMLQPVFPSQNIQLFRRENRFVCILGVTGRNYELFLMAYWRMRMPEELLSDWDISIGIPPEDDPSKLSLEVGGQLLLPEALLLWPIVLENGRLGIEGYSEALLNLVPMQMSQHVLYLMIHRCLGELFTMTCLEYVEVLEAPALSEPITLLELRDYVADLQSSSLLPFQEDPLDLFITYDMEPKEGPWGLREDIFSGSIAAVALPVLDAYYEGERGVFEYAAGGGAVWGSIVYSCTAIELEQRVNVRNAIEEELNRIALGEQEVGECVGGASGHQYSYIDCICYNFDGFLEVARQVMASYVALYQISEVGFAELRPQGNYFPLYESSSCEPSLCESMELTGE